VNWSIFVQNSFFARGEVGDGESFGTVIPSKGSTEASLNVREEPGKSLGGEVLGFLVFSFSLTFPFLRRRAKKKKNP